MITDTGSGKHILLHRPTPWGSEVNCSTKVFARLFRQAGWKVTYLENPSDLANLIKWRRRYPILEKSYRWADGIFVIKPFSFFPMRDFFPFNTKFAANSFYHICLPGLKGLVRKSGQGSPDVIWTAKPGSSILKKIFPNAALVSQVVDYYPAFRGSYIKALEKTDYERSEHIFLIGHALVKYLTDELDVPSKKISILGQGVALERYKSSLIEPEDIKDSPRPRAIWIGVLNKCDIPLLEAAAGHMQLRGGCIILIGPEAPWTAGFIRRFNNTYFLGPRSFNRVPAYLVNADIGLMLYNRKRSNVYKGQNPLKLYEYAAAGLPIISTPHEEFKHLKPPLIEVGSPEEIPSALDKIIIEKKQWQAASLDFANKYSWDACFKNAFDIICKKYEQLQSFHVKPVI